MIVALTGGIASGKTLVTDYFRDLGIPIIDTDVIARQLAQPGEPVWHSIKTVFGADYFRPDGELDREKLAQLIFADAHERRRLEAITHPAIFAEVAHQILTLGKQKLIIVAVPLLYEVEAGDRFDAVIAVVATQEQQINRLMTTRGYTRIAAEARIASQLPTGVKTARADYIIDNSGEISATIQQIRQIFHELLG